MNHNFTRVLDPEIKVSNKTSRALIAQYEHGPYAIWIVNGSYCIPSEVLDLRKDVYVEEWQIMTLEDVLGPDDHKGIHVLIEDKASNQLVACTHMVEAELSSFQVHSGVSKEHLSSAVLSSRSTVRKDHRNNGLFPILLYAACRHYRMLDRTNVVAYIESGDHPSHRYFKAVPLKQAQARVVNTTNGKPLVLEPFAASLEFVMYRATKFLHESYLPLISEMVADEIEQSVKYLASSLNDSALWRRAREMTLTKYQYGEFLAQLHNFVRYTTRVIAQALSRAEDKKLRAHFRKHLVEELDHEVIIEADLEYLGFDVNYLTQHKTPSPYIFNFNALQESLLANRHDPVMYMAVPFAVEGISAFITDENLDALERVAATWGVKDPRLATRFLTSHRNFDGQDGGHWQMTLDMIKLFVKTESDAKRFMSIAKATIINMTGMINEVVGPTHFELWSADALSDDIRTNFESLIKPVTRSTPSLMTELL